MNTYGMDGRNRCTHRGRNSCNPMKFREMSAESSYERGKGHGLAEMAEAALWLDEGMQATRVPVGLDMSNQMLTRDGHLLGERRTRGLWEVLQRHRPRERASPLLFCFFPSSTRTGHIAKIP